MFFWLIAYPYIIIPDLTCCQYLICHQNWIKNIIIKICFIHETSRAWDRSLGVGQRVTITLWRVPEYLSNFIITFIITFSKAQDALTHLKIVIFFFDYFDVSGNFKHISFLAAKQALHLQKWETHTQLAKFIICQQLLFGYSSSFEFKPTGQSHSKIQYLI